MSNYYCQIAGLPELAFTTESQHVDLHGFVNEITPYLAPTHLKWFNLLLYSVTHKDMVGFYQTGKFPDGLLPYFNPSWFDPETNQQSLLPGYLQHFNSIIHRDGNNIDKLKIETTLLEAYFKSLMVSEDGFINKWGTFEMNLKNYLAAKIGEDYHIPKENQLLKGNQLAEKLLEFNILNKEIQTGWDFSEKINALLETTDFYQKELAIDQLKWKVIDEINLFTYFSIDILLGYLQKLIILGRWKKISTTMEGNLAENIGQSIIEKYKTSTIKT